MSLFNKKKKHKEEKTVEETGTNKYGTLFEVLEGEVKDEGALETIFTVDGTEKYYMYQQNGLIKAFLHNNNWKNIPGRFYWLFSEYPSLNDFFDSQNDEGNHLSLYKELLDFAKDDGTLTHKIKDIFYKDSIELARRLDTEYDACSEVTSKTIDNETVLGYVNGWDFLDCHVKDIEAIVGELKDETEEVEKSFSGALNTSDLSEMIFYLHDDPDSSHSFDESDELESFVMSAAQNNASMKDVYDNSAGFFIKDILLVVNDLLQRGVIEVSNINNDLESNNKMPDINVKSKTDDDEKSSDSEEPIFGHDEDLDDVIKSMYQSSDNNDGHDLTGSIKSLIQWDKSYEDKDMPEILLFSELNDGYENDLLGLNIDSVKEDYFKDFYQYTNISESQREEELVGKDPGYASIDDIKGVKDLRNETNDLFLKLKDLEEQHHEINSNRLSVLEKMQNILMDNYPDSSDDILQKIKEKIDNINNVKDVAFGNTDSNELAEINESIEGPEFGTQTSDNQDVAIDEEQDMVVEDEVQDDAVPVSSNDDDEQVKRAEEIEEIVFDKNSVPIYYKIVEKFGFDPLETDK